MVDGQPRFRTLGAVTLRGARRQRELLQTVGHLGELPVSPQLTFAEVAARWLAEFEAKVAAGERRERTLDLYRSQLHRHLLPRLGRRRLTLIARSRSCPSSQRCCADTSAAHTSTPQPTTSSQRALAHRHPPRRRPGQPHARPRPHELTLDTYPHVRGSTSRRGRPCRARQERFREPARPCRRAGPPGQKSPPLHPRRDAATPSR
jgi:hypothetical protein